MVVGDFNVALTSVSPVLNTVKIFDEFLCSSSLRIIKSSPFFQNHLLDLLMTDDCSSILKSESAPNFSTSDLGMLVRRLLSLLMIFIVPVGMRSMPFLPAFIGISLFMAT